MTDTTNAGPAVPTPYAPLTTEQKVRLACLRMAFSLRLDWPVREVAGGLADFILHDIRTERPQPDQRPTAETAPVADQREGS